MIVLDTTVLVYAVGADHPLREPCREVLRHASELAATTTAEVIQEFAHVCARRRPRDRAVALAGGYPELLRPLMVTDDRALLAGLDLHRTGRALGAFDAVLAATARQAGATALASADRAVSGVAGPRHVLPGSPDWASLLA